MIRGEEPEDPRPQHHDCARVADWEVDLDSGRLEWSEEVYHIRGLPLSYTPTLEKGFQFYHPEDRPTIEAAVDRLKTTGETYDLELRERTADGEIYWVRTTGVPQYNDDGELTKIRGVYRDITEQKERQQQLDDTRRELEASNRKLNEFASIVSHDLRNPLNVAEGRLELAAAECDSDHLAVVERAHNRMKALITDLLTLAREGKTVDTVEPVVLSEVIAAAWESVDTVDARLVTETTRTILADRERLQRVFENLLRNAIEHGGDDVTVSVGDFDGGFYVEDDGPGIPKADREAVFESGYSTSREGTGFGLAIIEGIVTAHGWEIAVMDGSDGGARFEITGVEIA